MTYREALAYLDSFINYELLLPVLPKKPFDLRRIEQFLASVGDPHKKLRCIHVAGTKGKGSTCAFIAAILQRAGYRVGLYTSPHLSSFRERIRILDRKSVFSRLPPFEGAVSSSDFSRVLSELQPKLESFRKQPVGRELTFFEVLTVLAFVYFAGQSVDFVVLETGLGGRLDATNVVESLACCITPISYEHTALLGSTLGAIAKEKAGIIKGVRPSVVSAPQEKEAEAVITERCRRLHAKLLAVGDHIVYERAGIAREREVFHVSVLKRRYRGLTTQLVGRHQLVNACVALGAIEALRGNGIRVTERAVRSGLARTFWPARFEIVSRKPLSIVDGAQNRASCAALVQTIRERLRGYSITLVFGASRDKDVYGMAEELFGLGTRVILTKSSNSRAMPPQAIARATKDLCKRIGLHPVQTSTVAEALRIAQAQNRGQRAIVVTGSLFVAGEARELCL